ncbi:MAG: GNAT family N-acetyltransferase [Caldilinea sp.]
MITGRLLQRSEIASIWVIDRREVIDNIYYLVDGELELRPEHYDMRGWPPGESDLFTPLLLDCYDRGGWCYGLFDDGQLIGVAILESKFIGRPSDMLQLTFLHVSHDYRDCGLGRQLFERAGAVARERGAQRMYISATPSEHTINFYLGLGCVVSQEPDPELLALEPKDIHLEYKLRERNELTMQLISVNVGQERSIQDAKLSGTTGIYKLPVTTSVEITQLGLVGDAVVDIENHGGVDQAVYLYGAADYAWWSAQLGYELEPGTFGENLTISGLESAHLKIGDTLHVGAVTLQVSAPRIPCATLAARMGDPGFVKRFRAAERPGAYCRVQKVGRVQTGDAVKLERYPGETISVVQMFRDFYDPHPSEETIRRHLNAPIAERARADVGAKRSV